MLERRTDPSPRRRRHDCAEKSSSLALDFIKERMATKEDLKALRPQFEDFRQETRENFASLRAEIRDARQRLDALEEAARNSAGLTKEIDHLMERVRAIENHLGIQQKIAA